MFVGTYPAELVKRAITALAKKEGICEVLPDVRFMTFASRQPSFTLVCIHPDPGLNCGTAAEYCEHCQNKEAVAAANNKFNAILTESFTILMDALEKKGVPCETPEQEDGATSSE